MCKKAIQGAKEGAKSRNIEIPKVIGVTALTSLSDNDLINISYDELVLLRAKQAKEWGLDGIVCPASKAGEMEKLFGSNFLYITPGIKWGKNAGTGQKQLYGPRSSCQRL